MLHPEGPQIAADLEYLEEYLEVLEYFGASFEIYLTVSIHLHNVQSRICKYTGYKTRR